MNTGVQELVEWLHNKAAYQKRAMIVDKYQEASSMLKFQQTTIEEQATEIRVLREALDASVKRDLEAFKVWKEGRNLKDWFDANHV